METTKVNAPAAQKIGIHMFNPEFTQACRYDPKLTATKFAFELANNSTMIEEKGDFATCLLVGRQSCLGQLRMEHWIQNVRILEIAGPVHNCRQMWKMIGVFMNLAEWRIDIKGQYSPSELKLTKTEELEFNSSVTHVSICANWTTFRNEKPEHQQGIVALAQFCLKMAAKFSKLSAYRIEVPDDHSNCLYVAVGDFILKSDFQTQIIVLKKEGQILCVQSAMSDGQNSTEQAVMAPPPNPEPGQPTINSPGVPDCNNTAATTAPSAKRPKKSQ